MSTLTIKHKIDLFNKLYKEISSYGRGGDTELAHVNKYEAVVLKAMGGSGTVNPTTGLREYGWFDKDDPAPPPAAPTTTTVKQVSDLPEYFKPYVEELFATAQDVYERPYVPYGSEAVQDSEGKWSVQKLPDIIDPVTGKAVDPGKRLADVTQEQKAAFSGLQDLFTQVDPETGVRSFRDPTAAGFTEAGRLRGRGARGFDELGQVDPETGEVIKTAGEVFQETYMSPYKQAVTDIQTREAEKLQEQKRQQRQGAARMANALGGGRYGVQEALTGGIDAQLLDDIRKKGLQEAYTQGLSTFEADRLAASRGAEQELGATNQQLASQLKGLGALQTTGETQRAIAQQPLDIGYEEFARQQAFPKQNLQELSGILRGFQVQPSTYKTSQVYKQPPSLGSQLLAAGTLGAGISSGLGKSLLGKTTAAGGGLMGILPKKYSKGTEVILEETAYEDDPNLLSAATIQDLIQMTENQYSKFPKGAMTPLVEALISRARKGKPKLTRSSVREAQPIKISADEKAKQKGLAALKKYIDVGQDDPAEIDFTYGGVGSSNYEIEGLINQAKKAMEREERVKERIRTAPYRDRANVLPPTFEEIVESVSVNPPSGQELTGQEKLDRILTQGSPDQAQDELYASETDTEEILLPPNKYNPFTQTKEWLAALKRQREEMEAIAGPSRRRSSDDVRAVETSFLDSIIPSPTKKGKETKEALLREERTDPPGVVPMTEMESIYSEYYEDRGKPDDELTIDTQQSVVAEDLASGNKTKTEPIIRKARPAIAIPTTGSDDELTDTEFWRQVYGYDPDKGGVPTKDRVGERMSGPELFDFQEALPWFKMAAEFSKSGQDTADAAMNALTDFEESLSSRKEASSKQLLRKSQAAAYNAAAVKDKAWKLIEEVKAGNVKTKNEVKVTMDAIKAELKTIEEITRDTFSGELTTSEIRQHEENRKALLNQLRFLGKKYGVNIESLYTKPGISKVTS